MAIINNGNFINLSISHSCSWRALSGGSRLVGKGVKHFYLQEQVLEEIQSYSPPGGYFLEYRKVDM